MKKLTGLELIERIKEFSSERGSEVVGARCTAKLTAENKPFYLYVTDIENEFGYFLSTLSQVDEVLSYGVMLENGAQLESTISGRKLIQLSMEFSKEQESLRKSIAYTTRESGYLATFIEFKNNGFQNSDEFYKLKDLDAVVDYEIELENGEKISTKEEFWVVSERKDKTNWRISEIHTNATFEETLAEMKHGKNPIKPNYYKIPEGEVKDLAVRLLNDSKDILSTEQTFYFSHLLPYILRFPYKGGIEDLKKAKFYLDSILEGGQE